MSSDPLPPQPDDNTPGAPLGVSVGASVTRLQREALGESGERAQARARGHLAVLRRSAGSAPEREPLAFAAVLDALTPPLTAREIGRGDDPSPSERAAFDAVTLFALHMQSARTGMHVRDRSFGTAVGLLVRRSDSASLRPRFDALLAARDHRSRLTHARSVITLLRGAGIGVDYGRFAQDLRQLAGPRRHGVLLRWSRDATFGPAREQHGADAAVGGASPVVS